jgi:formylglycine-generating enzyme
MKRVLTSLIALSALVGCNSEPELLPPPGYHLVTIDTDAIVPPNPASNAGPPVSGALVPLFDRLEITVFRDGELEPDPAATRDFDVHEGTFLDGGASFTIEGVPGEPLILRARLYRSASLYVGQPRPETTIEVVAELPETPVEGPVETTLRLFTDNVGVPRGTVLDPQPIDADPDARSLVLRGRVADSVVGSWPGAEPQPCSEDPGEGEACVPGGAYWMGNPLVKGDDFVESDKQRLVALSPYFIDTREVTVGELRAFLASVPGASFDDAVTRKDKDTSSPTFHCTYVDEPNTSAEALPANCVDWDLARAYCQAQGKELPSEAQFEYASSELRSALFVWGADEAPLCGAAVWGRSASANSAIAGLGSSECSMSELGDGPQQLPTIPMDVNSTRLTDRITVGGVEIFDLAGNLQEWVLDRYNKQDEACWDIEESNLFVNPVCDQPGEEGGYSVRGGSWVQDRAFLRAAYRSLRAPDDPNVFIGFRCAREAD